MKKDKVLNIIQRYYPARGGAELFMKTLSEYQSNNLGYKVDVWTTNANNPNTLWDLGNDIISTKQEIINGVNIRRFPIGKGIYKNKYINKIVRSLFDKFPNFRGGDLHL